MIRFTPKPWSIVPHENSNTPQRIYSREGVTKPYRKTHSRSAYNFSVHIWSLGGKTAEVFNRHGRITREKMLANGRLVAASPDLYDILTELLNEAYSPDWEFNWCNGYANEIIDKAQAILKYVDGTGEKP